MHAVMVMADRLGNVVVRRMVKADALMPPDDETK